MTAVGNNIVMYTKQYKPATNSQTFKDLKTSIDSLKVSTNTQVINQKHLTIYAKFQNSKNIISIVTRQTTACCILSNSAPHMAAILNHCKSAVHFMSKSPFHVDEKNEEFTRTRGNLNTGPYGQCNKTPDQAFTPGTGS